MMEKQKYKKKMKCWRNRNIFFLKMTWRNKHIKKK